MGLQLNEIEEFELQGLLPLSDGFICLPFVHRLTRTYVQFGTMQCTGADMDDEGSDPENGRNAEGKEKCVEDPESEEGGYHVEITDMEASDGLLFEEVATLVCNLFLNIFIFSQSFSS